VNTANAGKDCQSVTISYQLSSQKCLEDGWTVMPLARRCNSIDTASWCDEVLEPDEPHHKVDHHTTLLSVLV